jgi:hypothetical protein
MRVAPCLIGIMLLSGPCAAVLADPPAQPAPASTLRNAAFQSLSAAVLKPAQNPGWSAADLQQAATLQASIRSSQTEIERRYQKTPSVSAQYAQTIAADASAINAATNTKNAKVSINLLSIVDADLTAKVQQAHSAMGGTDSLGDDVNVTVVTTHAGTEVSGYLVRANCASEVSAVAPRFVFTNPTSPTSLPMPAGLYVMWVEKNAHKLALRDVTIGSTNSPSQNIEINL